MAVIAGRAARNNVLLLLILFSLFLVPLCAAEGNFTISPATLAIAAVPGGTETRTFLLLKNSPDVPLDTIQIVPLDLNSADFRKVVPASAIAPGTPAFMNPPNGMTVPVTFYLNATSSGAYTGSLLVNSNSSTVLVPVTVSLKDGPLLPVSVLLFFTIFSVIFYDYATRGQATDNLKVKISGIGDRLDSEFPENTRRYTESFSSQIRSSLNEARIKLDQKDTSGAEAEYNSAAEIWTHWISFRKQWNERITQSAELDREIANLAGDVSADMGDEYPPEGLPIVKYIGDEIITIWDTASKKETKPDDTRTALTGLENRRMLFKKMYDDIRDNITNPPASANPDCFRKLRGALAALNFVPGDDSTTKFVNAYDAEMAKCRSAPSQKLIALLRGSSPELSGILARIGQPVKAARLAPAPEPSLLQNTIQKITHSLSPSQKLWLFDKLQFLCLPALVLFIIGYSQLYASNATFGANYPGDYFSLVLWGFATGSSSQPIALLIKDKMTKSASS